MYKYVCHVTVYFNKELHRIHRKTCLMDLSIGLRLPVLDINPEVGAALMGDTAGTNRVSRPKHGV